jgi:hypothetical protein
MSIDKFSSSRNFHLRAPIISILPQHQLYSWCWNLLGIDHVILKCARPAIKRLDTNAVIAKEKLRYDFYYVRNHGLFPDLVVILQTAEVVLWGKGAR